MRHLRKFNESKELNLKEFCDENLAFLLDKGFYVNYSLTSYGYYEVIIHKNMNNFKWEEVNYDVIPFLLLLNEKFIIVPNDNPYNVKDYPEDKKLMICIYNTYDLEGTIRYYDMYEINDESTEFLEELTAIEFNIKE